MDVILALARWVVGWLIGLIGKWPGDSSALAAGMKSWFQGREGTDGKSGVVVLVKRNLVTIIIGLNIVLAILVGIGYNVMQNHQHPTSTQTVPVITGSPPSCSK